MNYTQPSGPIPAEFLLIGLSWIQNQKLGVSFLFLVMYMMVILGNCTMIILIWTDHRLHKPMHVYIALLSLVDLSLSTAVVPKLLVILWFDSNGINSYACVTQMYFIYTMSGLESSLFALMALDRYIAVCHPLRHSTIMTPSFISKTVIFVVIQCAIVILPLPIMTANLTFCKPNIIYQSYCEFVEIISQTCGDLSQFVICMDLQVCLITGVDNVLIVFSYVNIFRVVQKLQSPEARWKTLNTCSAHAIMLSLHYISTALPLLIFNFSPNPPLNIKFLPAITTFLVVPLINPIVFGLKTKEFQEGLKRLYWRRLLTNKIIKP
ncbi:hypothetical protein GDO86_004791 [Hymenochirus boettgeri]|uniref:G-protein coupled receptors family 1 profile domain-containing protein n=1 Tax=Hymenochirus boettgeri TaxID=247094 RepID=A0A8T2K927_9PIPI|nr:hypothetical protein GDO86_004791 [Hymenochirus boettgeri]